MNYMEVILRSVAVYIIIVIIIRLLGKKELGQLSTVDLMVILIIAEIGSMAIENPDSFGASMIAFIMLFLMQKIFSLLLLKFAFFRKIIDGKPVIIVKEGRLNINVMKKETYTVDDLINQMRKDNVMDIKEIKLAILEINGDLSVFTYKENKEIILPVIVSKKIAKEMLTYLNLSEEKVKRMLKKQNYKLSDVYYASSNGKELFITKTI